MGTHIHGPTLMAGKVSKPWSMLERYIVMAINIIALPAQLMKI